MKHMQDRAELNLKKYQAFVFDFDGVLADSVEEKTEVFAKLFEEHGPEIQKRIIAHHRNHGGMSRIEKFLYYYNSFLGRKIDDALLATLCERFSKLVVEKVVNSPEIQGAKNFLEFWHLFVPCFIDSATPDEEIIQIVFRRGLSKYFTEVLGSGRTKTDNLIYILEKHTIAPHSCLFFGDAVSDYEAAVKCGVDFIGIVPLNNAPLLRHTSDIKWFHNFLEIPLPLENRVI